MDFEKIKDSVLNINATKDIESIKLLEEVQKTLDTETLTLEEERLLKEVKNIILEFLIKKTGNFEVFLKKEKNYDEGYFVTSLEELTPPYEIHEHYHINNEVLKLTEWYYTDVYGKKYRKVFFPEQNENNSFLLEDTFIAERRANLEKIKNDFSKFEI